MGDGWILLQKLRASFFNEDLPNEPNLARSISLDSTFNMEHKSKRRALSFLVAVNGPNPHHPVCYCSSNGILPSLCVAAGGLPSLACRGRGGREAVPNDRKKAWPSLLFIFKALFPTFTMLCASLEMLFFYVMHGIKKTSWHVVELGSLSPK
jgi:hypothetical protein